MFAKILKNRVYGQLGIKSVYKGNHNMALSRWPRTDNKLW